MRIKKAVIAAAGLGTRFLPLTKAQPKEMLPMINKPVIQYSVEEAVDCGVELVVMVTALGKRAIEDYFDRSAELEQVLEKKGDNEMADEIHRLTDLVDISYVRQKEQLGLGHALLCAEKIIGKEPFILILPDDLFEQKSQVLRNMIGIFQQYQGSVIAVTQVSEDDVSRYGIIEPVKVADHIFKVADLVEKPSLAKAPSNLAIMGRYVLTPDIFKILGDIPTGSNGEFQLTDGLKQLIKTHPIYGYEFEGDRYDAGTPFGWLQANIALAMKDPEIGPKLEKYLYDVVLPTYDLGID